MALPAQSGQLVGWELYKPQRGQEATKLAHHTHGRRPYSQARTHPELFARDTEHRLRKGTEEGETIPGQIINLNQRRRQAGRRHLLSVTARGGL